jgi:WD40 repeat protein
MVSYSRVALLALLTALCPNRPAVAQPHLERPVVTQLVFSPDGQRLIASYFVPATNRPGTNWRSWCGEWDLKTGRGVSIPNATTPVAFAPDGQAIAMGIGQRRKSGNRMQPEVRLALWQFGQREPSQVLSVDEEKVSTEHAAGVKAEESVVAAAFQPDGKGLAAVSARGQVQRWPIGAEGRVGEEGNPREVVNLDEQLLAFRWGGVPRAPSLAFDDAGKTLTLTAKTIGSKRPGRHPDEKLASTWQIDLATGKFERTDAIDAERPAVGGGNAAHQRTITSTWPSPDGKRIANVDDSGAIEIVDRDSGKIVQTLSVGELAK